MPTHKSNISEDEIRVEIDFSEDFEGLSSSSKEEVKDLIQSIVEDNLFRDVNRGISPIDGSKFPSLNKMYKKYKQSVGGSGSADLELTGDMLSSLTTRFSRNKLILEIKESQAPKAYNHIVGDTLPQRQFLPLESDEQPFRAGIMTQIRRAIREAE